MTIPILTVVCAAAPPNIAAAIPRDITIRLMTLIHIATSRGLVGIGLNLEQARSRRAIESVSRLQCVAFACSLEVLFDYSAVAVWLRAGVFKWTGQTALVARPSYPSRRR